MKKIKSTYVSYKRSLVYNVCSIRRYIYRDNKNWIKMINYVDDALYYANNDDVRQNFDKKLSERFHLSLVDKAKWYLGMRITQSNENITLDQD